MARHASTYRQARRAAWREHTGLLSWIEFNNTPPTIRQWAQPGRSKYMPHIGAKQRAKGAARAA